MGHTELPEIERRCNKPSMNIKLVNPNEKFSLRHFTAAIPQTCGCNLCFDCKFPIKKLEGKLEAKERKMACFNCSSVLGLFWNKIFLAVCIILRTTVEFQVEDLKCSYTCHVRKGPVQLCRTGSCPVNADSSR